MISHCFLSILNSFESAFCASFHCLLGFFSFQDAFIIKTLDWGSGSSLHLKSKYFHSYVILEDKTHPIREPQHNQRIIHKWLSTLQLSTLGSRSESVRKKKDALEAGRRMLGRKVGDNGCFGGCRWCSRQSTLYYHKDLGFIPRQDKVINICNPTALTVRWKVETGDPWKLTDQIVWCPSE